MTGRNLQSVDDTRDITQDGEKDVNEQVASTSTFEEDTQRWEDDGNDDFADISVDLMVSALSQHKSLQAVVHCRPLPRL